MSGEWLLRKRAAQQQQPITNNIPKAEPTKSPWVKNAEAKRLPAKDMTKG
jgi:hypothetical protein